MTRKTMTGKLWSLAAVALALLVASPAMALDDAHWKKAQTAIHKGIAYLRAHQNKDGSWTAKPGPAVTALAITPMLDQPDISADDPTVKKALTFIMSKVKPSGDISDGFLQNYNTSIVLSALARVNNRPDVAKAIAAAQDFLKGQQWPRPTNDKDPAGKVIDKNHRWYGGVGYGHHGRPDLSNTQMMLQGLYDSGVDCNDPAFQRALVFIQRLQGAKTNKMFGDKIVDNGGFIYAPSINKEHIDQLESKAGMVETAAGSRLQTYGTMTYAGFKSYLYANLSHDDPRVQAVFNWVRHHYTLDANPGMPKGQEHQGQYYYYMTFARALRVWGSSTITTADGKTHDWANDLIDKLVSLQRKDGSWTNPADRWMESDPNLVTSYALIALDQATK